MALTFPSNYSAAYDELINGSAIKGATLAYEVPLGQWFWPFLFLLTLIVIYAKTESPTTIAIYTILGNFALGAYLIPQAEKIFYIVLIFSVAILLFKIFGSSKTS